MNKFLYICTTVQLFLVTFLPGNLSATTPADEDIYVRTDRSVYFAGEQVWFRLWYFNNSDTAAGSSVAYFELVTRDHIPLVQTRVRIDEGSGTGNVAIPVNVTSGYYLLRCYTSNMKNFGPSSYYYQKIMILNPARSGKFNFPVEEGGEEGPSVTFYPSGGSLKRYLNNNVYVRTSNFPPGIRIDGFVVNEFSDTLARLRMLNENLGWFEFVPGSSANFLVLEGVDRKFRLPGSDESGGLLEFTELADNYRIALRSVDSVIFNTGTRLVVENAEGDSVEISFTDNLLLPQEKLFNGLNHFVLKDANDVVLAEYFLYQTPAERLVVEADFNKRRFNPREKVEMVVKAHDLQNLPRQAGLTVSVFKNTGNFMKSPALPEFLLLTRYAKKEIPLWDLSNSKVMDGFVNIYGRDLLKKDAPVGNEYQRESNGSYIRGKLQTAGRKGGRDVWLALIGDSAKIYYSRTDDSGNFSFMVNDLRGKREIMIKGDDKPGSGTYVLDDGFSPDHRNFSYFPVTFDTTWVEQISRMFYAWQVNHIYEAEHVFVPEPCRTRYKFYGEPDFHLDMDNYVELPLMEEVFFEIVSPVMVLHRDKSAYLKVIDRTTNRTLGEELLFIVDGVPVFDDDYIMQMSPSQVRFIDVVARKYFYGSHTFDGIVDITTREKSFNSFNLATPHLRETIRFKKTPAVFDPPVYSDTGMPEKDKPDYRNTLYWNPEIQTGEDGKAEISFYTSDEYAEYDVIIEGVDDSGNAGMIRYRIVVGEDGTLP